MEVQVLGTKQISIPMDHFELWFSTVNGSHYFVQNFELYEPRYETKQVLFWVDEKIELEKWVIRIEFELWVMSYELWMMLNSNKTLVFQVNDAKNRQWAR